MGKAIDRAAMQPVSKPSVKPEGQVLDWRKAMSDHVAMALIVYTGLQIFVTVHALKQGFPSLLPYIALIVLVAAIIPACHKFEKRWRALSDAQAASEGLRSDFRHDLTMLWLLAVGLPFLITGLCKVIFSTAI